jgi:hypothetical protein
MASAQICMLLNCSSTSLCSSMSRSHAIYAVRNTHTSEVNVERRHTDDSSAASTSTRSNSGDIYGGEEEGECSHCGAWLMVDG